MKPAAATLADLLDDAAIRVAAALGLDRREARLEGRVLRGPFYELVEWAEPRDGKLGVWSGGAWFELGRERQPD